MSKIPQTDSVKDLAEFWNGHDVTEFEDELEEVSHPVFDRGDRATVRLRLDSKQAAAVHRLAQSKGVGDAELLTAWVAEKLRTS